MLTLTFSFSICRAEENRELKSVTKHESVLLQTKHQWHKHAFSSNSKYLALVNKLGTLAIIDLSSRKINYNKINSGGVSFFKFSPRNEELWVVDNAGNYYRYDPKSLKKIENTTEKGENILWQPDTKTVGFDLFATAPGRYTLTNKVDSSKNLDFTGSLVLNNDGGVIHNENTLIIAHKAEKLSFWQADSNSKYLPSNKETNKQPLSELSCSNKCIVTAKNKNTQTSYLWSLKDNSGRHFKLDGRLFLDRTPLGVRKLASNKTGNKVAYLKNNTLGYYNISPTGYTKSNTTAKIEPIIFARFSNDGNFLFVKTVASEKLILLDGDTLEPIDLPNNLDEEQPYSIIHPSGESFIAIGSEGEAILISPTNLSSQKQLAESFVDVIFRFSQRGRWLLMSAISRKSMIFSGASGKTKYIIEHDDNISKLLFTPDEESLIIVYNDGEVKIISIG